MYGIDLITVDDASAVPEPLVYGDYLGLGSLDFVPERIAIRDLSLKRAYHLFSTWGELRARVGDTEYAQIMAAICGNWNYFDPEKFATAWRESNPDATADEIVEAYSTLEVPERLPIDEEPFEAWQLPFYSEEGIWPNWYQQDMLYWVPDSIQKKHGSIGATVHDGFVLTFDAGNEQEIVNAFEKFAYAVRRDDRLVGLAQYWGEEGQDAECYRRPM